MPRETINGIGIQYELLGKQSDPPVALTPGGRFHMETAGIRETAEALVAGGRRVLIYDRPSCGKSDAYVAGTSESENQAEVLGAMIRKLDLGPTAIIGGSGGSLC
jgi:pimeloyl-ACP methyl ester carboxylesterase